MIRQIVLALNLICLLAMLVACSESELQATNVEVSGTVHYEDKQISVTGYTGKTQYLPVRQALVDLVDANDEVVVSTYTDEQGGYTLMGEGVGLYLRVLATSDLVSGSRVRIKDYDGNNYAVAKKVKMIHGQNQIDINIATTSKIAGAFNMLDVFTSALQLVKSISAEEMPTINAFWEPQKSNFGTYFCPSDGGWGSCPQGKGMYILGGSNFGGDTDEYDDDVLWHEFGHYIESFVGIQDSPGGSHYLTENDNDLRLAWSEGWGGFFPTAVKSWIAQIDGARLSAIDTVPLSQFIDTFGSFAGISINMANPSPKYCAASKDCFIYSSSEVAVAKVLNVLHATFGVKAIWDVYSNYMRYSTSMPATLETFWDGWLTQRSPDTQEMFLLKSIFNDRAIYYQEDIFEFDDNVQVMASVAPTCVSTNCTGEIHYLYKTGISDADLLAFNAVAGNTYQIETYDLTSGADTYLRILNAAGQTVYDSSGLEMVNNDRPGTVYCYATDNPCRVHNDQLMLSSQLSFKPPVTDIYFVEVTSYGSKPTAAGRYGTYKVSIMQL